MKAIDKITQSGRNMLFRKKSLAQQLEAGILAPADQLVSGLLGWTFQHQPVFCFEQVATEAGQHWNIHFSHRCGFQHHNQAQWVASQLDAEFGFIAGAEVQFCPACVSLVDQLFAPNLVPLGLQNNYSPDQYFKNLVASFPYMFWSQPDPLINAKVSGFVPVTTAYSKIDRCETCGQSPIQVLDIQDAQQCVRCASVQQANGFALDEQSVNQAFIDYYQQRNSDPSQWSQLQPYLPAVWGRLLTLLESHQLPLPKLWQPVNSVCGHHTDMLPIVWPELGKAVLMTEPDAAIEWDDEYERWPFFNVLAQMT